jgi:hypothetical protein
MDLATSQKMKMELRVGYTFFRYGKGVVGTRSLKGYASMKYELHAYDLRHRNRCKCKKESHKT